MTPRRRRILFTTILGLAVLLFGVAYYTALVPATHPDHDHGIMNLDAGGRLMVTTRDGGSRNLVGRPGHVLVVHFFSTSTPGAAAELRGLAEVQKRLEKDPGVEFVLIARDPDFAKLDSWLAENKIVLPKPSSLVLDPTGVTTERLNCKRPLETMFFNPEGKLASQGRGPLDWENSALAQVDGARGGATIE